MYWIYKCNAKALPHQVVVGDWERFFASPAGGEWGSTARVPALAQARRGHLILAYQTDRNELVGVARVRSWRPRNGAQDLILEPIERLGVRVRPLKQSDPAIDAIPALRPGPIRTLYEISDADARRLLRAARNAQRSEAEAAAAAGSRAAKGAGFGTPEQNKRVEKAAVRRVIQHFSALGWKVQDLSAENRGYDLLCRKHGKNELHVEVKGTRGTGNQFILTENERRTWSHDGRFVLALVCDALGAKPSLRLFTGPRSLRGFTLKPVSHVAALKPKS